MNRVALAIVVGALVLSVGCPLAAGKPAKIKKDNKPFPFEDGLVGFICTKVSDNAVCDDNAFGGLAVSDRKDYAKAKNLISFKVPSVAAVEAQAEALGQCCEEIEVDGEVKAIQTSTCSSNGLWGLDSIDEEMTTTDGTYVPASDGGGSVVFVLDTGILETHTEFAGRISAAETISTVSSRKKRYDYVNPHRFRFACAMMSFLARTFADSARTSPSCACRRRGGANSSPASKRQLRQGKMRPCASRVLGSMIPALMLATASAVILLALSTSNGSAPLALEEEYGRHAGRHRSERASHRRAERSIERLQRKTSKQMLSDLEKLMVDFKNDIKYQREERLEDRHRRLNHGQPAVPRVHETKDLQQVDHMMDSLQNLAGSRTTGSDKLRMRREVHRGRHRDDDGGVHHRAVRRDKRGGSVVKLKTHPPAHNTVPDSKKAAIAARVKALQSQILGDFKKVTGFGKKAGYVPPPKIPQM